MKAAIYLGRENVKVRELPNPVCGDNDVVIKNIYSSICGTDVAVYTHGPNTGHRVEVGANLGMKPFPALLRSAKTLRISRLGSGFIHIPVM